MANRVGRGSRRKKRRGVAWQSGSTFQADRQVTRSRRDVSGFTGHRRRRWKQTMRRTKDADLRRRYQIIWQWMEGFSKTDIAKMLCCHRNSVANVLKAFWEKGELGLVDGRVANGQSKVTSTFIQKVEELVAGVPDSKWNHTAWTQELLTLVAAQKTGIKVSISTMCRVLKRLKARKGRPRPTVGCPWPAWKRQRRLRELRKLIETLPPDQIVLFADEIDIHLNLKSVPTGCCRALKSKWSHPVVTRDTMLPERLLAGARTSSG